MNSGKSCSLLLWYGMIPYNAFKHVPVGGFNVKLLSALKPKRFRIKLFYMNILFCTVPLLIFATIYYYSSVSNIKEVTSNFVQLFSSQLNTNISSFILELDNITKTVINDTEIISYLGVEASASTSEKIKAKLFIDNFLYKLTILKPDIFRVMLVSINKNIYEYSNVPSVIDGEILTSQAWFQKMLNAGGQLVITPTHKQPYSSNSETLEVFSVGRLIKNESGKAYGVILFEIEPNQLMKLNSLQSEIHNIYNAGVTVTTSSNEIIYNTNPDNRWQDGDSRDFLTLNNRLEQTGLTTTIAIPTAKLFSRATLLKNVSILTMTALVGIMLLLSFLLSRTISDPIKKLSKQMRMAERGQYLTLTDDQRDDEVGLLFLSYNAMIQTIKKLIEDVYLANIKQKQAQYLALQSQINPHMLYNTLETIRMKAAVNHDNEVALMIKVLGKLFRYNLEKVSNPCFIKDEIEHLTHYLYLQNLRYSKKYEFRILMREEVLNSRILRFVFQPIVENSIIHGFKDNNKEWIITIEGSIVDNKDILLKFTDNGEGIEAEKLCTIRNNINRNISDLSEPDSGIGLKNIQDRIKLECGTTYGLKILSSPKGTTIEMLIPRN